ncbi:MAG: HAD-IIA family hydrolase [Acidimicrobiia bacterium]|nr:HAD-IIA family hydrolase [Acidimicrobiia bacterium]
MERLIDRYERFVFDLDGTLWRGKIVLPHVREVLAAIRAVEARVAFMTNSPQRSRREVAGALHAIGVAAAPDEIVTSGRAACLHLIAQGAEGATAFVIGGSGLETELALAGLTFLGVEDGHNAEFVVVGRDESFDYSMLRTAMRAIDGGAGFLATNRDPRYPVEDGFWPGGGALAIAVEYATGVVPTVVGKPERPMLDAVATLLGDEGSTLLIGDKPEADLEGARRMGWTGALVLTGATADPSGADPPPDMVLQDLGDLLRPR